VTDHPLLTPLQALVARLESARSAAPFVLVGIGGHGGAGKTTLATRIAAEVADCQVLATDAFWDGAGFDLSRLRTAVLDPLLAGEAVVFDEWDWATKQARPGRELRPEGVVVVEGVCALHQMFRNDMAVRVWVDAPYDVRLARGIARDGEGSRATWVDVWIPNEEAYVRRDEPVGCAHLVIDGTHPLS
jgi:uridine kinase